MPASHAEETGSARLPRFVGPFLGISSFREWCGRKDLNLHTLTGTCTSSMRVCQFGHDRKRPLDNTSFKKLEHQPSASAIPQGVKAGGKESKLMNGANR